MFVENPRLLFADFGVPATHGAQAAVVLFDEPSRDVLDNMVIDAEPAITLPAADLPGLAVGEAVVVDGRSFTVREVRAIDDGKLKRVTLRAA